MVGLEEDSVLKVCEEPDWPTDGREGATELCGYDGDEVVDPPLEELTVLVWKDDEL